MKVAFKNAKENWEKSNYCVSIELTVCHKPSFWATCSVVHWEALCGLLCDMVLCSIRPCLSPRSCVPWATYIITRRSWGMMMKKGSRESGLYHIFFLLCLALQGQVIVLEWSLHNCQYSNPWYNFQYLRMVFQPLIFWWAQRKAVELSPIRFPFWDSVIIFPTQAQIPSSYSSWIVTETYIGYKYRFSVQKKVWIDISRLLASATLLLVVS